MHGRISCIRLGNKCFKENSCLSHELNFCHRKQLSTLNLANFLGRDFTSKAMKIKLSQCFLMKCLKSRILRYLLNNLHLSRNGN